MGRLALALSALAVVVFLAESWRPRVHLDDAYISYRYAKNLAAGHGLVFNLGERVEGFSNLLWVLFVALGVVLGFDPPLIGHWLGVASGAAVLVLTFAYARQALPPRSVWVAGVAPWILWSLSSFALWSTSGMETPLFTALVTAALLAESRGKLGAAVVCAALATLTRPDGVLVAGTVMLVSWSRGGDERRRTLLAAGAYGAFLALLTGFRLLYFGAPLPNTFYAKVGGTTAAWTFFYIGSFLIKVAAPLLLPTARGVRAAPSLRSGAVWLVVLTVYVAIVGGDAFPNSRFFLPAVPALIALAVAGAVDAWADPRPLSLVATACLPCAVLWYHLGAVAGASALTVALAFTAWPPVRARERRALAVAGTAILLVGLSAGTGIEGWAPEGGRVPRLRGELVFTRTSEIAAAESTWAFFRDAARRTAWKLGRRSPRVESVATTGVGVLGYYLPVRIVDILGLLDPTVARTPVTVDDTTIVHPGHLRGNAAHVLAARPDYILVPERERPLDLAAVRELLKSPRLYAEYVWDPSIPGYRRRPP